MPEAYVFANEYWLPKDGVPVTQEQKTMMKLIIALPEIVAAALQRVDGQNVPADHVAVKPLPLHPWQQNCAEIEIELEPGGVGSRELRFQVAQDVMNALSLLLLEDEAKLSSHPSLAISCQPRPSSGMMMNREGAVILTWGMGSPH